MANQSRLEEEGLKLRHDAIVKNDYQRGDQNSEYSEIHKDAKSDGDVKGKGVGTAANPFLVPNRNGSKTSYKNTLITDDGGSIVDKTQRNYLESINLYNETREYGPQSVDTSANVADGQYVVIS